MNEIVKGMATVVKAKGKAQAFLAAQEIINKVAEGEVNPLEALVQLTIASEALTEAIGTIKKDYAPQEFAKYGEKNVRLMGATFTEKEVGVKYHYEDDGEWQSYQDQIDQVKAMQKGRETTLKKLGQFYKTSTTSLTIALDKE